MTIIENNFNIGRKIAFETLEVTLKELENKPNISEKDFFHKWQEEMSQNDNMIAEGWYTPPPKGMSVLSGNEQRISFDSLRNEKNWVSDKRIDWNNDLLYVYASPVYIPTGMIGDIAVTLYFGKDEKIIKHFKNTNKAIKEIWNQLSKVRNSQELFKISQEIFYQHRLKNCIISSTDNTPLDLGHTFTKIDAKKENKILTREEINQLSKDRKFINETTSWKFTKGLQFTIEPQLVSIDNPNLPQISYHYLIKKEEDFMICDDIDSLLRTRKLMED